MSADVERGQTRHQPSRRNPVQWTPGEREALIAEALASGRVTVVPRGLSGHDEDAARRSFNGSIRRQ